MKHGDPNLSHPSSAMILCSRVEESYEPYSEQEMMSISLLPHILDKLDVSKMSLTKSVKHGFPFGNPVYWGK